jgi:signal peptidase I
MRKLPNPLVIMISLVLFTILVALWIIFAPTAVGGQASYVMVRGNSMNPGFHTGDLTIVKAAPNYYVGDIVTYYEPQTKAKIIHRIIAVEQDRYVLKGDNNSWIDPFRPTREEIVGKLWIHAPKVGNAILWLRLPLNMAFIVGIAGVLMIGTNKQPNKKEKRKNRSPEGGAGGGSASGLEMALYILGFFTLASLALTIYSFLQPVTRAADDVTYEQTGVYYYSAAMPPGIFDTEMLHSGEPVFTKLTCSIIVGYSYNITGPLQDVSGTQQLNLRVTDAGSGWGRTIPLKPGVFNGSSYSNTATVDLCQAQALVDSVGEKTGFHPNTTLTVSSQIAVSAKAGGKIVYDTFDSDLVFQFDDVHFYLVGGAGSDPLQSSKIGTLTSTATQPNTLKVLGFEFKIMKMRTLGVEWLGMSLLGLLIVGIYVFVTAQNDPETLIRLQYRALLMDVHDRGFENTAALIDVTAIADLARLAERQNCMILHMTRGRLHLYFVQSEGTTYRFVSGETRSAGSDLTFKSEILPGAANQSREHAISQLTKDGYLQVSSIPKKVRLSYDEPLQPLGQDDQK